MNSVFLVSFLWCLRVKWEWSRVHEFNFRKASERSYVFCKILSKSSDFGSLSIFCFSVSELNSFSILAIASSNEMHCLSISLWKNIRAFLWKDNASILIDYHQIKVNLTGIIVCRYIVVDGFSSRYLFSIRKFLIIGTNNFPNRLFSSIFVMKCSRACDTRRDIYINWLQKRL